jgi:hypothetical protein
LDTFHLPSQIKKELQDFFQEKVHIAGVQNEESARYLNKTGKHYEFSQWEMINKIDLAYNSKFESGPIDSEGQRKLFLNICKFRSDVASKQIDLDVKNFQFIPEDGEKEWAAFFMEKEFHYWAKENHFGELLNTCVENFPKYGWVVLKEVKGNLEFVPVQTIRNQQDAESLATARYVIIEHEGMTLDEMQKMKNWDTDGLDMDFNEKTTVYERYGFATRAALKSFNGEEPSDGDDKEVIDTLSISTLKNKEKGATPDGNILFWEEIKERPFVEGTWTKVHGRLMGVGEIENQLENQIGTNMSFNLFRRQLLWSSKKIFQSSSDDIAKNLVKDVRDGDVLQVGTNGQISPVDMSNRAIGDFSNFGAMIEKNADQRSFTFEAATGEQLPSGTPFRLGVLMSNAVASHFDLKREKLGFIMKQGVVDFVIPNFKKQAKKQHTFALFTDEAGFEALKAAHLDAIVLRERNAALVRGELPDMAALKAQTLEQLDKKRFLYTDIEEAYYDDFNHLVTLTVTGEEIDLPKKIETIANAAMMFNARGDFARADKLTARGMALTGENFDILSGPTPAAAPAMNGAAPAAPGQAQPSPVQATTLNQPATAPATL